MLNDVWAAGVGLALPHPTPNGVLGCGEAREPSSRACGVSNVCSEGAWQRGELGHG